MRNTPISVSFAALPKAQQDRNGICPTPMDMISGGNPAFGGRKGGRKPIYGWLISSELLSAPAEFGRKPSSPRMDRIWMSRWGNATTISARLNFCWLSADVADGNPALLLSTPGGGDRVDLATNPIDATQWPMRGQTVPDIEGQIRVRIVHSQKFDVLPRQQQMRYRPIG